MNKVTKKMGLLCTFLLCSAGIKAQEGSTGYQFLEIPTSAHAAEVTTSASSKTMPH